MTDVALEPGCILHWDGFILSTGEPGHKFFVIVGAQPEQNYLAIRATSKRKHRDYVPGGNPDGGWYHIPGGERDWFKLDTWLLFDDPQELLAKDLLALKYKGEIKAVGILRHDIANAICNCMRRCDDVSEYHKGLLGSTRQPPKK
jgi:hypothetical protein